MENQKTIFVICWRGRDFESGVWLEDWPCYAQGVFTKRQLADIVCERCNRIDPPAYDADAEIKSGYWVKEIPINLPGVDRIN